MSFEFDSNKAKTKLFELAKDGLPDMAVKLCKGLFSGVHNSISSGFGFFSSVMDFLKDIDFKTPFFDINIAKAAASSVQTGITNLNEEAASAVGKTVKDLTSQAAMKAGVTIEPPLATPPGAAPAATGKGK